MSPRLLDLSTELVIQILAHLSSHDIGACAQTSRRLRNIISSSQYLQYLVRTEVAGVHDPFFPGLSIHERISVLEKWERAWHGLDLRQPALQCIVPRDISVSVLHYEIHGGYLVATRRFPADDRPMGYSYIDLDDVVRNGHAVWNNIDLLQSLSVFAYCFNVEEYNLAVMLVFNPEEDPEPHGSLRLVDFSKGTDHPLASSPNIPLQFEGKKMSIYDAYDVHMEVAGDNVIVMITQARALPDLIFLVGWKLGNVSLILTAPDLTYASSFALINTESLALVNLQTNTLEIHRIVGGASFVLTFPKTGIQPLSASFRLAQAFPAMCSARSQCLPFQPSTDACLVGLTAVLAAQDGSIKFYWLATRRDYFYSLTKTGRDSDDTPTPWETWSQRTACCVELEHPLAAPIPAGARWLVHSQPLVVREFGLSRSQRIQADRRTYHDDNAGNAIPCDALQDVFASQLPYFDIISVGERKYQSVTADYEWVVGMNEDTDGFSRRIHRIDIHHVV
ncbi:hypothetical protein B0F90DRAFT_1759433 [Multifurca ochricompacta]|uniref:F-box domain-containing protein n=1 Tax=Multifurca ochricompacta TaxID=376703 RepID=A0AAD4LX69_9AGAM|nr:hypothetical protein B0F90DRAFT_1759433 [Multifurca ochricompacta]